MYILRLVIVHVFQIASRVLEIPMSSIHTMETSTAFVPNGTPTCASYTTDLQGMAVKVCKIVDIIHGDY